MNSEWTWISPILRLMGCPYSQSSNWNKFMILLKHKKYLFQKSENPSCCKFVKKYEFYVRICDLWRCVDFYIIYLGKRRAKNLTQIYNMFWKIKLDSEYNRIACWEYDIVNTLVIMLLMFELLGNNYCFIQLLNIS